MKFQLSVAAILVPGILATPFPNPQTTSVATPPLSTLPSLPMPPMPPPTCGMNQEYKTCGSPCPPSCLKPAPICAAYCKSGCQCKKGYILNVVGFCVPKGLCFLDAVGSLFGQKHAEIAEVEQSEVDQSSENKEESS